MMVAGWNWCYFKMAESGEGSNRSIPGPAGIVQRAMWRRERGKGVQVEQLPTQEYLQKALSEPEYDDCFTQIPWQAIQNYGYLDMDEYTPISKITESRGKGCRRIPLIVGIIKSFKLGTGLGCGNIELKDETGSMKGSIHFKVLEDPKFFGKIRIGTAMVISSVVIMSPSNTSNYINITKNNVSLIVTGDGEVISQDMKTQ